MTTKELEKLIDKVCKTTPDDKKAVKILMDSLHDYMWDDKKNDYNLKRLVKVKKMALELLGDLNEKRTYGNALKWKYKGTAVMKDGSEIGQKSTGFEGDGGLEAFKNEFIYDILKTDYEGKRYHKSDIKRMEITTIYY